MQPAKKNCKEKMITYNDYLFAKKKALEMINNSVIFITKKEKNSIEIADFGLSNPSVEGAQIITLVSTERVCLKIIILFNNQTIPEHIHAGFDDNPGKQETLRVISGKMYLYTPGENNMKVNRIPRLTKNFYTVRHEISMLPGNQITLEPNTKHWLQAGNSGAIVYSVSSNARDDLDIFTNNNIVRKTVCLRKKKNLALPG